MIDSALSEFFAALAAAQAAYQAAVTEAVAKLAATHPEVNRFFHPNK
jgi:hypothetical protein